MSLSLFSTILFWKPALWNYAFAVAGACIDLISTNAVIDKQIAVKDEESTGERFFPDQFHTALLVLAPGLAEG